MPRFAANVSMLFTEYAFLDRFDAAAQAGFGAVELQFPYAFSVAEIRQRLSASGLPLVLHNLPAGDWAAGERGIACHPGRVAEFRAGVAQAVEYANALGVMQLNCLTGIAQPDVPDAQTRGTLVDNLAFAADALHTQGMQLLLEPINTFDIPGFYVNRTDQALAILDAVGAPNTCVQYDIYHAHRMQDDLLGTLRRCLPRIGHVQLADSPGRHEPGTGDIDYRHVLGWLDQAGYAGYVGCEYIPRNAGINPTQVGLGWLAALGYALPGRAV